MMRKNSKTSNLFKGGEVDYHIVNIYYHGHIAHDNSILS